MLIQIQTAVSSYTENKNNDTKFSFNFLADRTNSRACLCYSVASDCRLPPSVTYVLWLNDAF